MGVLPWRPPMDLSSGEQQEVLRGMDFNMKAVKIWAELQKDNKNGYFYWASEKQKVIS